MWSYNVANNNGLCVMWYEMYYRYRNNNQQWFTCNLLTKYWKKQMNELVPQIVTQQLGYKKHCAKSTGWW